MWYKARPVLRRGLLLTLLALIAVQLLGGVALASVCDETCPDDADESSCPPICATCATCPHSRHAIVQTRVDVAPSPTALPPLVSSTQPPSSPLAADIFHVPLAA